jgi:hypothetical protein
MPPVLYTRSSTWAGAGPGKVKLEMKALAASDEIEKLTGAVLGMSEIFFSVEEGNVFARRTELERAVEYAVRHGRMLVAPELTRLVRPARFYTLDRRDPLRMTLRPTQAEFDRLRELTRSVPLATLVDPAGTGAEQHSAAVKRRGIAGRAGSR